MDYNSINKKILKLLQNNYSMYLQLLKEQKYEELLNKLWDTNIIIYLKICHLWIIITGIISFHMTIV